MNWNRFWKKWGSVLILTLVLILFCAYFQEIKNYLGTKKGTLGTWDTKYTLFNYVKQHIQICFLSSIFSCLIGGSLGLLSISKVGKELASVLERIAYMGQMIPSIAMLSFLVPILGMNEKPGIVALTIIGILPIYIGVVTGIRGVRPDMLEVARGMGMTSSQSFFSVTLPLAMPVIISGIRMSLIINVSAATLAAKTGGGGLGILLLNALRTGKAIQLIEGTIPVCLLALIIDKALRNIEDAFSAKTKNEEADNK